MEPSVIASSMTVVGQIDVSTTTHILTAMDIFKEVSLFYESAWSKLVWAMGSLLVIIGIIAPFINNWIQQNNTKKMIKSIDDKIKIQKEEFKEIILNQKREYESKIEEQKIQFGNLKKQQQLQFETQKKIMQSFYDKTKYDVISLSARFWHAQAKNNINNDIAYAIECVLNAIFLYNESKDMDGILRAINVLKPYLIEQNKNNINKNILKQIVNILNKIKEDKSVILDANLEANINIVNKFYSDLLNGI